MTLDAAEFARRRRHFMAAMAPQGAALFQAAPEATRSRDTQYPYRPDSDFYYLTGFAEPEAFLLLLPNRPQGECILFCRPRNKEREQWEGLRLGPEGALLQLQFDEAFDIHSLDDQLIALLDGRSHVYYPLGQYASLDERVMRSLNSLRAKARLGAKPPEHFVDSQALLHAQRLIKSPAEVRVMQQACSIAANAHVQAMRLCRPGLMEYQLEGHILQHFAQNGARFPAYNTIVGGGANACILHYINNDSPLEDGHLVLIDAGCEFQYYASDITRTFPVNGRFSPDQRALYDWVLKAQLAAIAEVAPGKPWQAPHTAAVRVLTEGLIALGLIDGPLDTAIEQGTYKPYYMHRTGHWLGMDVHDVGDYKQQGEWRLFEPGMVLTVEPGLYIAVDDTQVDARWRGIGIRIEDDVLVTAAGCQVLTEGVPKTCDAIEALMAQSAL